MTKYFVYCLKNQGELVYIGSTTKMVDRMKAHKKDKEFDEVWYCELPDEKTMLEVEAYGISQRCPRLNKVKPDFSIVFLPDYIKWKKANLDFLRRENVDVNYYLAQAAYWEYYMDAMRDLGIPTHLFGSEIELKHMNDQIVAVFDGTGMPLIEFLKDWGYVWINQYTDEYCRSRGWVSADSYEKSVNQFD